MEVFCLMSICHRQFNQICILVKVSDMPMREREGKGWKKVRVPLHYLLRGDVYHRMTGRGIYLIHTFFRSLIASIQGLDIVHHIPFSIW